MEALIAAAAPSALNGRWLAADRPRTQASIRFGKSEDTQFWLAPHYATARSPHKYRSHSRA